MTGTVESDHVRAERLLAAQAMAEQLFSALGERGVIAAGVRELAASDAIRDLAVDLFGAGRVFPRRVVRAGPNTLVPDLDTPPERVISDDDIVFCDLGQVVGTCESDVGRTFVVGDDPVKQRLRDALPVIWDAGRRFFDSHPDATGAQLHRHVRGLAAQAGWQLGQRNAGHLADRPASGTVAKESLIAPGNNRPMRRLDRSGRPCHWILQVHLVDPYRQFGGVHEQLLDLRRA